MTESTNEVALTREGDVFVLRLGGGENRFNPDQVEAIGSALAEVESAEAPRALVTVADGKHWSNGLDLDWMGAHPERLQEALHGYHRLLAATLGASVVTVAAVQGHAFAAGAMFATAHDLVVMRRDRGYWCVPEVDIHMPFTPGMTALLRARLSHRTAHEAMVTGRRYTGPEAVEAGIATEVAEEGEVRSRAVELAAAAASKDPATLRAIKLGMYGPVIDALRTPGA